MLSKQDIFHLAGYPSLPSRLIETRPPHSNPPYNLTLGPLDETDFDILPNENWTVLVQGVDRHIPEVADLLDHVSFLPNWRLDDIQVSYATRGGGVGPHVDNYDVFLVQGHGRRRWRLSNTPIPHADEQIVEDCDVRVLNTPFQGDGDWILEPGDALYVPPRFPHHGVCESDSCSTFSIGFRAPTASTLLVSWLERLVDEHRLDTVFYQDDTDDLVRHSQDNGRISQVAAGRAYDMLMNIVKNDDTTRQQFMDWFASEVSQQKTFVDEDDFESMSEDDISEALRSFFSGSPSDKDPEGVFIRHQEGSVFTYVETTSGKVSLFVDGEKWDTDHVQVARTICNNRRMPPSQYSSIVAQHPSAAGLFRRLLQAGFLYVEQPMSVFNAGQVDTLET